MPHAPSLPPDGPAPSRLTIHLARRALTMVRTPAPWTMPPWRSGAGRSWTSAPAG